MPPVFLAFSLSFLYPMPLWKVGAQFVKKYCTNDAKKSYFAVFYGVSLTSTYCLKTPKSLKIKILKLSPPPTPRPAKPTGEKLKAIFIAFRHLLVEGPLFQYKATRTDINPPAPKVPRALWRLRATAIGRNLLDIALAWGGSGIAMLYNVFLKVDKN